MKPKQQRTIRAPVSRHRGLWLGAGVTVALLLLVVGCRKSTGDASGTASKNEPSVRRVIVVKSQQKTIRRAIGQPGVIEAFERTPIVSKIPGYVLKWNVDIGDPVRKDEVLAELWVPELVSQLNLKVEQVHQAEKSLAMAKAQVATAAAQVHEAQAALTRAEANNSYWKSQSARFTSLVKESVLDKQTQEETLNQFRSAAAALTEAQAKVQSTQAMEKEKESARDKAEVDIRAADADRRRQADLLGYATLTAPYDGVVTQRTINTKQFVQPGTGSLGDVLYIVERTDIVRIFMSVPETDASWVRVGAPAIVRVQALQGQEFQGAVARTASSLNQLTRTLRTEVDLPNPDLPNLGRRLRPGMYAYGTIDAEWRDVTTVPASAVVTEGDVNVGYQSYCYLVEDGRVKRTQIEIGVRNDQLIEILRKRVSPTTGGDVPQWEAFNGTEVFVKGELSAVKDAQTVEVSPSEN